MERGPSTDHCGIPLIRSVQVLKIVFIFTLCFLFSNFFWKSFKISSWFQIATRNGLHISEITLRHFIGMFESSYSGRFTLPTDISTSALSTPEKWKVDVIVNNFAYLFHARMIFIFSYSVIYRSLWE